VRTKFLVTIGLVSLFAVASAYGQENVSLRTNISFQFTAQGKVLPAGDYAFTPSGQQHTINVLGPNKQEVLAPVITRLAGEMHTTPADAHVVFDKVGETYFLSEIWIPGSDGYVLRTTKEKHEHRVVNVPY
jgi:hypothetical protein